MDRTIFSAVDMSWALTRMTHELLERNRGADGVVLLFHAFSSVPKGARLFSMMTRTRAL